MKNKSIFKIWTEEAKSDTTDTYCYLRLDQSKIEGAVSVMACHPSGEALNSGAILVLDSRLAVVVTFDCISDDIPLKTDITNSVLVYSEPEAREALRDANPINMSDIMSTIVHHINRDPEQVKEPTIN